MHPERYLVRYPRLIVAPGSRPEEGSSLGLPVRTTGPESDTPGCCGAQDIRPVVLSRFWPPFANPVDLSILQQNGGRLVDAEQVIVDTVSAGPPRNELHL